MREEEEEEKQEKEEEEEMEEEKGISGGGGGNGDYCSCYLLFVLSPMAMVRVMMSEMSSLSLDMRTAAYSVHDGSGPVTEDEEQEEEVRKEIITLTLSTRGLL